MARRATDWDKREDACKGRATARPDLCMHGVAPGYHCYGCEQIRHLRKPLPSILPTIMAGVGLILLAIANIVMLVLSFGGSPIPMAILSGSLAYMLFLVRAIGPSYRAILIRREEVRDQNFRAVLEYQIDQPLPEPSHELMMMLREEDYELRMAAKAARREERLARHKANMERGALHEELKALAKQYQKRT